jgi:hypothetical protein
MDENINLKEATRYIEFVNYSKCGCWYCKELILYKSIVLNIYGLKHFLKEYSFGSYWCRLLHLTNLSFCAMM